ncbi:MAG: SPFH domain-containing protein [Clostridia bacterium]|nr:SPFH domain-containing protein [Clostridia bacterium]
MGLIKAIAGATGGVLADQWKEYIYCDSLAADVLVAKGQKRTSRRSSNRKGEENIITNGSVIAVNEGQCMIIVDQGKVAELCAEPGEFVYDSSTEPSIFYGGLGKGILDSFKAIGRRFTFGGDTGKDQRVYFFNTKEIAGNKYGTASPIPFRVVDRNIGLDVDIEIRCHGEYSYKITDPILFYTNVCGNVQTAYMRQSIDSQLKSELMTALQPAFAKISSMGIRYSALPGHTMEIADALNEVLSKKWGELRGIRIYSFGVNSVTAPEEDEKMIKELQRNATYRDPRMAGATLVGAQAQAMQDAAKNPNGAMMGFAGINMVQGVGGMNPQGFYAMGNTAPSAQPDPNAWQCACGQSNTGKFCSGCGAKKPEVSASWTCSCGTENVGKFCQNCGAKKPEGTMLGWTCSCGTVNSGKFCQNCGAKKPSGALTYRCDKCGWEPNDPTKPPKFCPECGDLFDESDAI